MPKEAEYGKEDIYGMKVAHSIQASELRGDEAVLTLKDEHVLTEDGKDLNEAEDEIENARISELRKKGLICHFQG